MGYDIELGGPVDEARVAVLASALGLSEDALRRLSRDVPPVVKRGVDDGEAEALFHQLRELGVEVRLRRLVTSAPPSGDEDALPLPEFEAPAPPRSHAATTSDPTMRPRPLSNPQAPSSSRREPSGDAPASGDLLAWQNTKIYWVYAGLALAAVGVWMIADPDMIVDSDLVYRRARFARRVLGLVWSRPGGVAFIVLGAVTGICGWLKVRDGGE